MIKYLEKESDFDLLIKDKILVDFYADWCGPCKMMGEILADINSIDILKVNTDMYQNIANRYGIMSIPTLILFNDGKELNKMIGLHTKEEVEEFIK